MPAAILGPVAGAVVGGLMGGDEQQSQTQSREPWAPLQPWMIQNAQTGQNLQGYYQQNPFNQLQRTSYQNIAGDIDNFRNNINPGLMDFANRLMGTNYSRQGGPSSGTAGGSSRSSGQSSQSGRGGQSQSGGGDMGSMFDMMMQDRGQPNAQMGSIDDIIRAAAALQPGQALATGSQGMQSTKPMQMGGMGRSGPFVAAPSQSYGLIDWREMNPFTATNGIQAAPAETAETEAERRRREEEERTRAAWAASASPGDSGA